MTMGWEMIESDGICRYVLERGVQIKADLHYKIQMNICFIQFDELYEDELEEVEWTFRRIKDDIQYEGASVIVGYSKDLAGLDKPSTKKFMKRLGFLNKEGVWLLPLHHSSIEEAMLVYNKEESNKEKVKINQGERQKKA